ncbi:MAG: hypothetical protein KJ049_09565 [Gammaproteobacteria bacterium]|jgi:hypothetical protein|nr:hypothetical protein [Gammaproteobacteria bacterium]
MKATGMLIAAMLAATLPAFAGDDHDHDHDEAPAALAGPAAPRFAAASDDFELVGVLDGRRLMLYLGHYGDSSPVQDARVEIEVDGVKVPVETHGEGQFEAVLGAAPEPGAIPVAATIHAGDASGLLAGELDIHGEEATAGAGHAGTWRGYAGAAAVLLLVLLGLAGLRRYASAHKARGGVA